MNQHAGESCEEPKAEEKPALKGWEDLGEIKVNFTMAGPRELWVVRIPNPKKKEGDKRKIYLRASTPSVMLPVYDKRMATRFDSMTWAAIIALSCGFKGAKPVPVKFKAKSQTWVYKSSKDKMEIEKDGSKVVLDKEGIKVESDKPIEVPQGTDEKKTGTDE